jgi:hypothetical protein
MMAKAMMNPVMLIWRTVLDKAHRRRKRSQQGRTMLPFIFGGWVVHTCELFIDCMENMGTGGRKRAFSDQRGRCVSISFTIKN